MATMLRSCPAHPRGRESELTNATATFCRPVPCGPVTIDVEVLRSGRTGAQVHTTLRRRGRRRPVPERGRHHRVRADVHAGRPTGRASPAPGGRRPRPRRTPRGPAPIDRRAALLTNFFDQTDWRVPLPTSPPKRCASSPGSRSASTPLRPTAPGCPRCSPCPRRCSGLSVVSEVAEMMGPLTAPSLQIGLQLCAPARAAGSASTPDASTPTAQPRPA